MTKPLYSMANVVQLWAASLVQQPDVHGDASGLAEDGGYENTQGHDAAV